MRTLTVLILFLAVTVPALAQAPDLGVGDGLPVTGDQAPLPPAAGDSQVNASASTPAGQLGADVSPTDVGVYLHTSLPGPGFSYSLSTSPQAATDAAGSLTGTQETNGWGPAVPVRMPEPTEAGAMAGVATAAAIAYAAFRWRYLGPWFLLPMYSRLSKDDLLENETRSTLLQLISQEPGLALQDLADQSGAGWGTTVYHLQRLEQAGFVKSHKQGHHRRFYRVGEVGRDEAEALGMLRNETPRKIAQYLVQDPGCNQKAICQALDISPSLAHKYLKRMEEQELVSSEREWRSKHYTPDDRLATLVQQAA